MNEIGFKWQPGQQAMLNQGGGPRLPSGSQGPARLLSLRLPQRGAPNAVAPTALLQGQGAAGAPGGGLPGFLTLLQRLLNQQGGGVANQLPAGNLQPNFTSDGPESGQGQTMRLNAPGFQMPSQAPTQRVTPSAPNIPQVPTPRITIGQDAPYEGEAPGFF